MRLTTVMLIGVLAVMTMMLGACVAAPAENPAAQAPPPPADKAPIVGQGALTPEQRQQVQAKVKELREAGAKPDEVKAAVSEMLKGFGVDPAQVKLGAGGGKHPLALPAELTKDQRKEVLAKVKEMKQAGAKPDEVKTAVREMLKGWGLQLPAQAAAAREGGKAAQGLLAKLTDQQRQQVLAKVKEMKDAGAKPEEIKAAVTETLKGFGVEVPAGGLELGKGQGARAWLASLTKEQRQQVLAKVKELRAADAKPEEIKAAVTEMLKGFGVTVPAGGLQLGGAAAGGRFASLTKEQREQVQAKVKEMRAAGAKPEEVKATVTEMLKGFGVQPAAGKHGAGLKATMEKLTPEQRTQVQAKVKELRAAAKTPEEIRAAVTEMLKGFGVELPQK